MVCVCRDAVRGCLERRGVNVNACDVFLASSKTPLPLIADCYMLGGNHLHVKGAYRACVWRHDFKCVRMRIWVCVYVCLLGHDWMCVCARWCVLTTEQQVRARMRIYTCSAFGCMYDVIKEELLRAHTWDVRFDHLHAMDDSDNWTSKQQWQRIQSCNSAA